MCSEVMYGAYYPYLYAGRAGPGRPFYHQYDRVSLLSLYFAADAGCTATFHKQLTQIKYHDNFETHGSLFFAIACARNATFTSTGIFTKFSKLQVNVKNFVLNSLNC
jgi:hypothetical protein